MPRFHRVLIPYRLGLLLFVCACSTEPGEPRTGSLALNMVLEGGEQVDLVLWTITGPEMDPMQGDISVTDPNATASVEVFGIPPADGYRIGMTATSTNGQVACEGAADFSIEARTVTSVHVMLRCTTAPRFGAVRANGKLNVCAELDKAVVSPLETAIGGAISLTATASDEEGDGITYMWTAAGGTIADPNAPTTSFTCLDPGEHLVRVVVSDDAFDQCDDESTISVRCVPDDRACTTDDDCDDQNVCTIETCHVSTGTCLRDLTAADGGSCSRGNQPPVSLPADSGQCAGGGCVPSAGCSVDDDCPNTPPAPASSQCTRAVCATPTGFASVCMIDFGANEGVTCDFTGPGTADGLCGASGECVAAPPPDCSTDPSVTCTIGFVDDSSGTPVCATRPVPAGGGANCVSAPGGGLGSCDGAGNCQSFGCASDADCSDGNRCTVDLCEVSVGLCISIPAADGTRCNLTGEFAECVGGVCVESDCTLDSQCESGGSCRAPSFCDLATGDCESGEPLPNGTPCPNFQQEAGACIDGFCGCADDDACASDNPCRGDGSCDATTGLCVLGPPINEGLACERFFGPLSGRCADGSCVPACNVVSCPDDGNDCTLERCNTTDGSCGQTNVGSGFPCDVVTNPGFCDGTGTCEPIPACLLDGCPDTGAACTLNECDVNDGQCKLVEAAAGTPCQSPAGNPGTCDGQGECSASDSCPVGEPREREVTVACTNSVNPAQSSFPYTLQVTPTTPIEASEVFTVDLAGVAIVPEFFLDAAQGVVPSGVREAILEDAVATVAVRSGATGPDVALRADGTAIAPGPTRFCNVVVDLVCTSDEDCPVGPCRDPVIVIELPTSDDCSPGGVCDMAGKLQTQCEPNGFCVTGDAPIPLATESGTFTADAEGLVRFGWAENVPGESVCPTSNDLRCVSNSPTGFIPNEGLILPRPPYASSAEPIGIRVNVNNALFVPLQCAMVEQGGLCQGNPIQGCPFPTAFPSECNGAQCIFGADVVFTRGDDLLLNCAIE